MNQVAYLLDEHVPASVGDALSAVEPSIHYLHVGIDAEAPPKQTPDPGLLEFAEGRELTLVTFDKRTMPGHAADHVARGRQTWGVLVFPRGHSLSAGRIAEALLLV